MNWEYVCFGLCPTVLAATDCAQTKNYLLHIMLTALLDPVAG
jgi:hypothetical protein